MGQVDRLRGTDIQAITLRSQIPYNLKASEANWDCLIPIATQLTGVTLADLEPSEGWIPGAPGHPGLPGPEDDDCTGIAIAYMIAMLYQRDSSSRPGEALNIREMIGHYVEIYGGPTELDKDVVTLLKRIRKFSTAQDIGARADVHIYSRIMRELVEDAVTLLKRIRKFFLAQDIGALAAIHIFHMISFAIAKGVGPPIFF
ncbi:hypothetical protein Tco_1029055 [Tanacetum coccineum]|uniref:Uncharacterized protein n=1 Tax=Tanacetum coccineum TaxID=301880 RepID=A0ABQ5G3Y0_9ASTR